MLQSKKNSSTCIKRLRQTSPKSDFIYFIVFVVFIFVFVFGGGVYSKESTGIHKQAKRNLGRNYK